MRRGQQAAPVTPTPPQLAVAFTNGVQTIAAGTSQRLVFEGFRVAPPAFCATGDAATKTVQNASGDDGIALLERGAYQVVGGFAQQAAPPLDGLVVSWDSIDAEMLPASWANDNRGAGYGRQYLGVAQYTSYSWSATPPPVWFAVSVSNVEAVDIDLSGFIVLITFWPGDSEVMNTIY